MLILGLLDMYFDAAVVFFTSQTLFLRLALAILWLSKNAVAKYAHDTNMQRGLLS